MIEAGINSGKSFFSLPLPLQPPTDTRPLRPCFDATHKIYPTHEKKPSKLKNPIKTQSTATPSKPHHPPQPQTQMRSSIVLTRPGHSAICTAAEKPQKATKHHLKGGGGSGGSEEEFFCLTPDDVTRSRNASERSESAKHHQLPSSSRSGH